MKINVDPPAKDACIACPIRHNAVCALCETAELDRLEEIKSYRKIPAGRALFRAGDPVTHLASVVTGVVGLSRTLEDGRRQTVALLMPSDFIGRPGREVHPFDIEACTDVTLCRFERAHFEEILGKAPRIASRLLTMTLDELDASREWAVVLGRMTAREKIAAFVGMIGRRLGTQRADGGIDLEMPFTREAMADHLGLTLETASRQISALRRDGLIETSGRHGMRILDTARLAEEAGTDEGSFPI